LGKTAELLPGTLDMLILKAVSLKPLHGFGVLQRIRPHYLIHAADNPHLADLGLPAARR
jgi:hypothetical protein